MTKKAKLYRMVMKQHICPYGLKAKELLTRKGYEVEDHKLTSREATEQFTRAHQVETTPQIFINDQRVGGYEALRKYLGLDKKGSSSYTPIIAIFMSTFI